MLLKIWFTNLAKHNWLDLIKFLSRHVISELIGGDAMAAAVEAGCNGGARNRYSHVKSKPLPDDIDIKNKTGGS